MKLFTKHYISILLLPVLILKKIYFWHKTNKSILPGKRYAEYGFEIAGKLLQKGEISLKLILVPVSIFRYFEFDYASKYLSLNENDKILDVSSPYLFGFYQSNLYSIDYHYINPDKKDLSNVISFSKRLEFKATYSAKEIDVLNLPFENGIFDKIVSISVIEHIAEDGDSLAMEEMWRVLKPGGLLLLSFPVKKEFEIEHKEKDLYNLNIEKKSGVYFFQRIYDEQNIKERLLSSIDNFEIIGKEIFGAITKEFYNEYKRRWIKYSYWETVKDPYYITKYFTRFSNINELEDIGVMGLTIKKIK